MTDEFEQPYSEEERQIDYDLCCNDLYYLGTEILGYEDADEKVHRELCDFIEGPHPRKILVGCRGIYKTCFGTVARAIQLVLQNPNNRILVVQNSATNASKTIMEIKDHFESNEKLRRMCRHLIPEKRTIKWSSEELQFKRSRQMREPTIMAAGVGTSLTSLHFEHILGDDIVSAGDDEMKEGGLMIIRPEDLHKAIGWYKLTMNGLEVNVKGKRTMVQFIVNRWGVEDFASYIMQNQLRSEENPSGFEFLQMAAHREDGSLLWPNGPYKFTEEGLKETHRALGDFIYNTQIECRPYNPAQRGFPPESNVYWQGDRPPNPEKNRYKMYALMDIADVAKAASCYTSMVVLWVDQNNHIWVGEAIREKLDTVGKISLIHRMVKKYGLRDVYIEENLHKDLLKHVLKNAMKDSDIQYNIKPLKHKNRNKEARILRLQPHHEQGALHVKRTQKHLLQEMREFPYSHWRDTIDALGYIMDFIKRPKKLNVASQEDYDMTKLTIKKHVDKWDRVYAGEQSAYCLQDDPFGLIKRNTMRA